MALILLSELEKILLDPLQSAVGNDTNKWVNVSLIYFKFLFHIDKKHTEP